MRYVSDQIGLHLSAGIDYLPILKMSRMQVYLQVQKTVVNLTQPVFHPLLRPHKSVQLQSYHSFGILQTLQLIKHPIIKWL